MSRDTQIESVRRLLEAFLRQHSPRQLAVLGELADDSSLTSSGVLDSIQFLELVSHLEDNFDCEIDFRSDDPREFTSVRGLADALVGKTGGSESILRKGGGPELPPGIDSLGADTSVRGQVEALFNDLYTQMKTHGMQLSIVNDAGVQWLEAITPAMGATTDVFVHRTDELVDGFVQPQLKQLPRYLGAAVVGDIAHIYVRPTSRDKAVGARLLSAAEAWLRWKGVESIEVKVAERNQSAIRFYESNGYVAELVGMRKPGGESQ